MTVYGTDRTKADEMPALLASRKMIHPVLLDPKRVYREATGLAVYPVATLLDRQGRVVWQGRTALRSFDEACARQLEALMAGDSAKGAGPSRGSR